MPVLFSISIALGLAKEDKGVAAFAGFLGYYAFLVASSLMIGTGIIDFSAMKISTILGVETVDMGATAGIIAGLVTAALHNKYHKVQFPAAIAFYGGKRFVALIVIVTMAGIILGILSLAKVSESIAWVKKFNTGMGVAGLVDGTKYINMTKTQISDLEAKRVLFAKTYVGYDGVYMNDSYTMDIAKSDYNAIERMRTMDKAARGVRAYLLPYVAGNVEIDASTGQIAKDSIEVMKNEGNRFLEQMERDGELSGCSVEIDSNQNVLATSTIKVVIQNVPMGVSRNISIEMGYAESV